jgi:hypothetical protein
MITLSAKLYSVLIKPRLRLKLRQVLLVVGNCCAASAPASVTAFRMPGSLYILKCVSATPQIQVNGFVIPSSDDNTVILIQTGTKDLHCAFRGAELPTAA